MDSKKVKAFALIFLMHIVILVIYLYSNAYMHEQFHFQNGKNFGCVNGSITINWKGGQYTCYKYSEFQTPEQRNNMNVLDSQNEIVSYNLNTFAMLLTGLSLIIFVSMVEIFYREDEIC